MEKIDRLLKNGIFVQNMQLIEEYEKNRQFCLHGIEHSLDVARICYIICLENQLGYSKELIYAMALLHDIGRALEYKGLGVHHEEGARLAESILREAGFNADETDRIVDAILCHKMSQEPDGSLRWLLFKADKLSRSCHSCRMYRECYWSEELKNKTVVY